MLKLVMCIQALPSAHRSSPTQPQTHTVQLTTGFTDRETYKTMYAQKGTFQLLPKVDRPSECRLLHHLGLHRCYHNGKVRVGGRWGGAWLVWVVRGGRQGIYVYNLLTSYSSTDQMAYA